MDPAFWGNSAKFLTVSARQYAAETMSHFFSANRTPSPSAGFLFCAESGRDLSPS